MAEEDGTTHNGLSAAQAWLISAAIICDNFSPHMTTANDSRVGLRIM